MKKILILLLVLSMGAANADTRSPLPNVKERLEGILQLVNGRKTFDEMKATANERNTDIDIAFDNYLIAKKNISVARANFNPITTGTFLGVSMGLSYLWAPVAVEAVLSIPTKIYDVTKNKYLSKVAFYNLNEAHNVLNNELAHLYYDILTHEAILRTIDEEIEILTYQEARWTERNISLDQMAELKKRILRLGMERVDIYDMYVTELASVRTLNATTDETIQDFAQVGTFLNRSITANLNEDKLQSFALKNSDKYKASINLDHASQENIKEVKWSILSWSGLNFSYKKRIKEAKNEEQIAATRKEETEQEVKTNTLLQLQNLNSSLDILANYNSISEESLKMFSDSYVAFQLGQLSEDDAIEASLGAIRDFRNKVVAHYGAWSNFDNFSSSVNYDFKVNSQSDDQSLIGQLEKNPLYRIEGDDFKIVKKVEADSIRLMLSSPKIGSVSNVDYVFTTDGISKKSSDDGKTNYAVVIQGKNGTSTVAGVASVRLENGHEFNVKFNL
ncbi:MAG: TolC family protein [Bacteriovorax sp.]